MLQSNSGVSGDHLQAICPVAELLAHISDKWVIGILVVASHGPVRFTELERELPGISRRMLTLNLRRLERDGLLSRKVYPTVPPKVEYALTEVAAGLNQRLFALTQWIDRHREYITNARLRFDQEKGA